MFICSLMKTWVQTPESNIGIDSLSNTGIGLCFFYYYLLRVLFIFPSATRPYLV